MVFRSAHPRDLGEVERLLRAADLTTAGLRDHVDGYEVVEDGGRIIGSAGLEVYGSSALLRSVAVAPAHQKRGLARALVQRLLAHAAANGVGEVYLLTTGAADYFRRFGFEAIARHEVASAVRASAEFGDACCASAQAMRLRLDVRREAE